VTRQVAAVEVVLLTQEHCSLCERAKQVLDGLAAEYSLRTTVVDLAAAEGRAPAADGGILFPPGVFLDGEPFCYGRLSERKLRRELDRRRQSSRR
jgi:glutaredoxin